MKRIILFFFGKRIRKIFVPHIFGIGGMQGYNEFIASPISEWRDRIWLLKRGVIYPAARDKSLQFLQNGRFDGQKH